MEALETALTAAPEDLIQALAGSAPHLQSGSLLDWQRDLTELSDEMLYLEGSQRGRRGAPVRNARRNALAVEVYRILRRGGFPLKKTRDGLLANVLVLMFVAAGERVPEDLFPVLTRLIPAKKAMIRKVR